MTGENSKQIIIFGSGELAEIAAFYFTHDTERSVAAFAVDGANLTGDCFCGRPLLAMEEIAAAFPSESHDGFIAVGYSRVNALRQEKCEAMMEMGYRLTSYVSSRATVFSDLNHGWNAFILEDNTIQPFVRIGNGVTLWSGNHIGHHATIGDFAFISSHVVISGGVKIGARSFMGVNSTTNDHISIGERCVIGSGAILTKDIPDEGVVSAEAGKLAKVPSSRLKGF